MKSRFVFSMLLFALFFNISHDLFISNQIMSCDRLVHEVVEIDKNECCSKVSDLHENFHFTAILYEFHTQSINPLQMTLTFVQIIPPTSIYKTSLKPPIA